MNRLKPSILSTGSTMSISNSVLEPTTISNTGCKFVLDKKGVLDVGSIIQLAVTCSTPASNDCFFPIKTGIHSLIKKASLKIGDKVIDTLNLNGQFQTVKLAMRTNEDKTLKSMVNQGVISALCPSNQQDGKLQIKDVVYSSDAVSLPAPFIKITNSDSTTPLFSVKISELFRILKGNQFPLQLISDPVSIEIDFMEQGSVDSQDGNICTFGNAIVTADKAIKVSQVNCKMLVNYLTYSDETMQLMLKNMTSPEGINYLYEQVISIPLIYNASIQPGAGVPTKRTITSNLGLNGMLIKNMVVFLHKKSPNLLLGKYSSDAFDVEDSFNVRINDEQYFSQDITNSCLKSYYLSEVFGNPLQVHNAEYSKNIATNKSTPDRLINNQPFSSNTLSSKSMTSLLGAQYYIGVDFGKGILSEQKPIEFIHNISDTSLDFLGREVVFYVTVEKLMNLRNGQITMNI